MSSTRSRNTARGRKASAETWIAGIDIGGTFTDLTLWQVGAGRIYSEKVLTTPSDPSEGTLRGFRSLLDKAGVPAENVKAVVHATTVATNAVIERKGPRIGLITTSGFRDVLELGTGLRYDIYDLYIAYPEPLVPRARRLEVGGRIDPKGNEVAPLAVQDIEQAVNRFKSMDVQSVAVCFLHSYANPRHEQEAARAIERICPGLSLSLSSQVASEAREYERTVTTTVDAYVKPLVENYLDRLSRELREEGFPGGLFIMLSHGGIARGEDAAKVFPVRMIESGPAAGVLAAGALGRLARRTNLLSFDMGGTTAKLCLIRDGEPAMAHEFEVARVHRFKRGSGYPLRIPAIELIEIGAGGGSIARVDRLGLLKVGPESAGAEPGPACYGRGGENPTVTDANLLLGFLDPAYFLGGDMSLDADAARRVITKHCAAPLGVSAEQAAAGIYNVVCENMADAARVHIAEQGEDPRRFVLMAFGGAGPLHACALARKLGIREVICPTGAGVISSLGQLTAPPAFDLVRTFYGSLDSLDWSALRSLRDEMAGEAGKYLKFAGVQPKQMVFSCAADMRCKGQGYDIRVPLPDGVLGPARVPLIRRNFWNEYKRLYGRSAAEVELEIVNLRLTARGPKPALRLDWQNQGRRQPGGKAGLVGKRRMFVQEAGGFRQASVYSRYHLEVGAKHQSPALVEERESTVVIGGRSWFETDSQGNLLIHLES